MSLSEELAWRGFIKDKTFSDKRWLDKPQTFYHGVDGSADSLTIGNLAALMLARRLIDSGWKAILLTGGATSLIGDPKTNEERELKSRKEILHNVEAIKKQVSNLFSGKSFVPVDNYDWFSDVKYLDFLREVGKSFSITDLMQREFVTERMDKNGKGISYAEFSYSLIQGYDYWHLHKNHNVSLQIGGSDQWGNMLSGVTLIRKKEAKEVHALSMPLVVNKATGAKFGKSEEGAIWLDPAKTPPTQFYQFWINVDDADVEDYLKIYTLLTKEEIDHAIKQQQSDKKARPAQRALAAAVTELVHGRPASEFAQQVSDFLTGVTDIAQANEPALKEIRRAVPALSIQPGSSLIDTLVEIGLAGSNSEARRLINEGAIYWNNQPFARAHIEAGDFQKGRAMLRRGKAFKDSALIELK